MVTLCLFWFFRMFQTKVFLEITGTSLSAHSVYFSHQILKEMVILMSEKWTKSMFTLQCINKGNITQTVLWHLYITVFTFHTFYRFCNKVVGNLMSVIHVSNTCTVTWCPISIIILCFWLLREKRLKYIEGLVQD